MIFLRPFFLLLLLIPFFLLLWQKKGQKKNAWAAVCDPELLPYLTVDIDEKRTKFYYFLMSVLWCVASIALAGPAFLKADVPTSTVQSALIVVADMSPATDEKALEQITHKLYDLAKINKDTHIGMVLVDKNAYVALPLTQDKNVLKNIIGQLNEKDVMPAVGQNIPEGIALAEQLLKQSNFQRGQILVFTAGIDEVKPIEKAVNESDYDVFFIGVGDKQEKAPVLLNNGSFWNDGKLYGLQDLKKNLNFISATLDNSDLQFVMEKKKTQKIDMTEEKSKQYQDLGIWGIVLLLPFLPLLFRKGVLFCFILCLLYTNCYAGFWQRTEQEDYQTQMNAIENFNAQKYEDALKGFSSLSADDIESLYNQGNTLAYMGKIDEAIQSYERVLKQNPHHEDAAFNLEYLKKQQQQLQQAQEEKQQQSGTGKTNQSNDKQDSGKQDQSEQQQSDNQNNQSEEKQQTESEDVQENNQESENNNSDEKQSAEPVIIPEKEESEQANEIKQLPVSAAKQKQKEWFDRINPDAGRVLRYRLRKQYGAQK